MNWNGKPTFCPQCGKQTITGSGDESISNTTSNNDDHYICSTCNNEMNINYNPNKFIDVSIDSITDPVVDLTITKKNKGE